jgi:molecular chaperone DnaJ
MSATDGMRADWANKDFYAQLGVKKDATAEEIKKAYRKLARANHPDSHPDDPAKHEKFKTVAEAYDVIGDP